MQNNHPAARPDRPFISHEEAQEAHEIVGGVLASETLNEDARDSLERALEILSIVVSDTDPEGDLRDE